MSNNGNDTPSSNPAGPLQDAKKVKARQFFLMGVLGLVILSACFLSVVVSMPSSKPTKPTEKDATRKSLMPGTQVSVQDAIVRSTSSRLDALEHQNKTLLQRLEQAERERIESAAAAAGPKLVTLPPSDKLASMGSVPPALANPPPPLGPPDVFGGDMNAPTPNRIPNIEVVEFEAPKAKAGATAAAGEPGKRSPSAKPSTDEGRGKAWIPAGSFVRAVLLTGLDAPTGQRSQADPHPVLLRVTDNATLPNFFRGKVKSCFVIGSGYGDLASERAKIRTETLSCIGPDGLAIEIPLKGWVIGEDGSTGVRGTLVTKQGAAIRNALIAGVLGGLGNAMQSSGTTVTTAGGTAGTSVNPDAIFKVGVGQGVSRSADRLANYYISLADQMLPVIEVGAGRSVEIALSQGVNLGEFYVAAGTDGGADLPALASRSAAMKGGSND
jgi:conjugal transfer pilus assembly protein TraB